MLTAQTVEVTDATPVLHISVGTTQPDALINERGDRSLRSFYRERVDTFYFPHKRSLSQTVAPSIRASRKKPTLRASKQQGMVEVLTGFGG